MRTVPTYYYHGPIRSSWTWSVMNVSDVTPQTDWHQKNIENEKEILMDVTEKKKDWNANAGIRVIWHDERTERDANIWLKLCSNSNLKTFPHCWLAALCKQGKAKWLENNRNNLQHEISQNHSLLRSWTCHRQIKPFQICN